MSLNNTAENLDHLDPAPVPNTPPVVEVAPHHSPALLMVIFFKGLLSLSLVWVAWQTLQLGVSITIDAAVATQASQILEWGEVKISSSGFGAIVMTTSVLFGWLAYRSRPRFEVQHGPGGASVSVDGVKVVGSADGRVEGDGGPDDDEPPPASPAGFGAPGVSAARLRSSPPFQVSFPQKDTEAEDGSDDGGDDDDPPPSAPAGAGSGHSGSARALTGRVLRFTRSKRR